MNYRTPGTWQPGGKWGTDFDEKVVAGTLSMAIDGGINFINTANVYKGSRS